MLTHHALVLFKRHTGLTNGRQAKLVGHWYQLMRGWGGVLLLAMAGPAFAQHAQDNAVTTADDAFGTTIGNESLGLYSADNVRGFSPVTAGNIRIEGLYFDIVGNISNRVVASSAIHVGPSAQAYPLPAPTGIYDVTLKPSGNTPSVSPIFEYGPFGSVNTEIDAAAPIIADRLSVAFGFSGGYNRWANGGDGRDFAFGVVPRWHISPSSDLIAFFDTDEGPLDSTRHVDYVTSGDFLPGRITRGVYPGPFGYRNTIWDETGGLIDKSDWGAWSLRAGLFYSASQAEQGNYVNLALVNVPGANANVTRSVIGYPATNSGSLSGELRVSRKFEEGRRKHELSFIVRGRDNSSPYGDGVSQNLGPSTLNGFIDPPAPKMTYGALTRDLIQQTIEALSWRVDWTGLGIMTLGLQHTRYSQSVTPPGQVSASTADNAILPSMTAAVPLTSKIALYGSYVKGLENAGVAPGFAANGGQVLPADRTQQEDGGIRWTISPSTKLIAGYFDVSKPYFTTDSTNVFHALGTETHQGVEISMTSTPLPDLTIVTGAVIGHPRVSNMLQMSSTIGTRPVGLSDDTAQFNVNYTLPFARRIILDGDINYYSSAPGTLDNRVLIGAYAIMDAGIRFKFKIDKAPVTLRAMVTNITNAYTLFVISSGIYAPVHQRGVAINLAGDF